MTRTFTESMIALGALLLLWLALFLYQQPPEAQGSTNEGQEYYATTTYAQSVAIRNLKVGYGSLAQVTITGDNTGLITLYNATTSDVTKRTGQKATSTIILADFPASTLEGTYTFDASFTDGLLVVTSGTPATSTITYR